MVAPFYSVVWVSTKKHNELNVYNRIVMYWSDSGVGSVNREIRV